VFDVCGLDLGKTIDTRRMMGSDDEVQVVYKYLLHVIYQQNPDIHPPDTHPEQPRLICMRLPKFSLR